MIFRWEPLIHLLQTGLYELGAKSWEENGYEKDTLKFNPDWKRYQLLENEDVLRWMAARVDGELVGYASIILTDSFHDCNIRCAIVQDIYLSPEYRKGKAGIRFLWVIEEQLKALNVHSMSIGERIPGKPVGKIYERLGYRSEEKIWTKSLIEGNA